MNDTVPAAPAPVARKRSKARGEFLVGVFTTAIENYGYGWFLVHEYRHEGRAPEEVYAVIEEEEGDSGQVYSINIDTMAAGLAVIRNAIVATSDDGTYLHNAETFERLGFGGDERDQLLLADRTNGDDGDCDVVGALAVLECALFGEVRYA
jgi:hypothetical protein